MFLASNGWSNDEGARIWPTFVEETCGKNEPPCLIVVKRDDFFDLFVHIGWLELGQAVLFPQVT